jgi:LysM repeat protein
MKNIMKLLCLLLLSFRVTAQNSSFDTKAMAYVQQYASWAIEEQKRVGIPAAITLAQGIYETSAGESELATQANNHFGIKCKKEWKGATFAHTDDAPNECFRKYKSAQESYVDHSNYLKTSLRYAELFDYDVQDYAAWAKGLKRCGYATNPAYAQKLIKMIEDYQLQQYTLAAISKKTKVNAPKEVPAQEKELTPKQTLAPTIATAATQQNDAAATSGTRYNGLRAVYCRKGENLLDKALAYNIRYAKLLEMNELPDEPLKRDMYIYLEPKRSKGVHVSYMVQEGETIETIAHNEAMTVRQLRVLNLLALNEQPIAGAILNLQEQADVRPATYMAESSAPIGKTTSVHLLDRKMKVSTDEFVATKKTMQTSLEPTAPAPAQAPVATTPQVEEVVIGYGAEAPVLTPAKEVAPTIAPSTLPAKANSPVSGSDAPNEIDPKAKANTEEMPAPEEPQDDFAKLKAKLDKAVYARSSASNVKVSSTDSSAVFSQNKPVATATTAQTTTQANHPNAQYHVVQKGDTGYSIAKQYGIKVQQLNEWNNLDFGGIKIGQKLRVR